MTKPDQMQFYPLNYGDTRLIAFKIFQQYFDIKNNLAITQIFDEVLNQNAKKNSLSFDDYLNQIDDNLLNQILIGIVENQKEIFDYILQIIGNKLNQDLKVILALIIFELKFLIENSTQNIFEDYQKICNDFDIKFSNELFVKLVKEFREFEYY